MWDTNFATDISVERAIISRKVMYIIIDTPEEKI